MLTLRNAYPDSLLINGKTRYSVHVSGSEPAAFKLVVGHRLPDRVVPLAGERTRSHPGRVHAQFELPRLCAAREHGEAVADNKLGVVPALDVGHLLHDDPDVPVRGVGWELAHEVLVDGSDVGNLKRAAPAVHKADDRSVHERQRSTRQRFRDLLVQGKEGVVEVVDLLKEQR